MTALQKVTAALEARGSRRQGPSWQCPSHDDRHASLSVTDKGDGVLLHCHAGCATESVVAALGLTMGDLYDKDAAPALGVKGLTPEPVATFDYRDEQGALLYQVLRLDGKHFRQRRPDGDGWAYQLNGCRRVLYHLRDLLSAPKDRAVFVVEGEKDAETLRARGLIATTNSGGAEGWRPEIAAPLADRRVLVLPDNDQPGRRRAQRVAKDALAAGAAEVRVVDLPGLPEHGDVTDWLGLGHTVEELRTLVAAAPRSGPPVVGVLLADVNAEPIRWYWRGRIALGTLVVVDGDPGLGKSLMLLDWAGRNTTGRPMPDGSPGVRGGVVILSGEDHLSMVIRPRLDNMDADLSRIVALPVVPEADGDGEREPEIPADLEYIEKAIKRVNAVLVIVDPLMAFLGGDVNSYRDQDVRRVLRRLRALAEKTGTTIVVIRHLNKASGGNPVYRGGGSIGIIGAARSGLLVAKDPEDESRRILACTKFNLGLEPSSLAFHIEGAPNGAGIVKWDGASDHTSATLLAVPQDENRGSRDKAIEVLKTALAHGPRPVADLRRQADALDISRDVLRRAREELGLQVTRESKPGGKRGEGEWRWGLPPEDEDADVQDGTPSTNRTPATLNASEYKSADTPQNDATLNVDEKPWTGSVEDYASVLGGKPS